MAGPAGTSRTRMAVHRPVFERAARSGRRSGEGGGDLFPEVVLEHTGRAGTVAAQRNERAARHAARLQLRAARGARELLEPAWALVERVQRLEQLRVVRRVTCVVAEQGHGGVEHASPVPLLHSRAPRARAGAVAHRGGLAEDHLILRFVCRHLGVLHLDGAHGGGCH